MRLMSWCTYRFGFGGGLEGNSSKKVQKRRGNRCFWRFGLLVLGTRPTAVFIAVSRVVASLF